jgi:hypothetical protein
MKRPGWVEITFDDGDQVDVKLAMSRKGGDEPGAWRFL